MNYRYIKALDNISLAYDVITKKDGVEWMESCNIAVEHITNGFVFELMKQYRSMGYDVPCKMLALKFHQGLLLPELLKMLTS